MKTFIKNFNSKNLNAYNNIKTIKNSTINKFQASNFHNLNYNKNSNTFITNKNSNNFMRENSSFNFSTKISLKDKILNILDPDQVTSVTSVRILMYNIFCIFYY
jgi:hypothetical protein